MRSPTFLNALRAFEAAARHGSFSDASVELNVTSAAVGQLVRSLEDWLGTPLFHRSSSGRTRLTTTEAADRALPEIRAGLDRLSAGLERMKEAAGGGILTVAASPAFAAKWLLPRIDRFQSRCPDTDVRLDTSLKLSDYVAQGIDVGVRYGAGSWAGLTTERLMEEDVFPVCSPTLLQSNTFETPSDLSGQTLIHDLSVDPAIGFETWDTWFQKAGVGSLSSPRGLRVNSSAAVLQAAVDGHGIALARSILAADDVSSGRLVRLFPDIAVTSALAYYIAYRPERRNLPRLLQFREWLFEEAETMNER